MLAPSIRTTRNATCHASLTFVAMKTHQPRCVIPRPRHSGAGAVAVPTIRHSRFLPRCAAAQHTPALSSKEKKEIRSRANAMGKQCVVFQLGKNGATEAAMQAVDDCVTANEIIRVKIVGSCPLSLDEATEAMETSIPGAVVVGHIGNTLYLYKPK
ncbi:CRM domain-containing protein [Pseudoscourfieldia marina]